MMKRSIGALMIIGVIVVAVTVGAFFLLNIEKIVLHTWSFSFLLLAEFVLCVGLILTKTLVGNHSGIFVRAGIPSALLLYFITVVICTFLTRCFQDNLNTFILLQLVVIAVFAIAIVLILTFSNRIDLSDRKVLEKMEMEEFKKPKRGGF